MLDAQNEQVIKMSYTMNSFDYNDQSAGPSSRIHEDFGQLSKLGDLAKPRSDNGKDPLVTFSFTLN